MSLVLRAVSYRLFAGTTTPARTLRLRGGMVLAVLVVLAWGMSCLVPTHVFSGLALSALAARALVITTGVVFCSLAFLLAHGFQRSVLDTLGVLRILPLYRWQQIVLYMYSFLPLCLGTVALSMPIVYNLFGSYLSVSDFVVVATVTYGVSMSFHMLMRVMGHHWRYVVQPITVSIIGIAYVVGDKLLVPADFLGSGQTDRLAQWAAWGLLLLLFGLVIWLACLTPCFVIDSAVSIARLQHRKLSLYTSVVARALRTRSYTNSFLLVLVLVAGMALAAYRYPQKVSFQMVFVLGIVLLGGLAQEVRSLSRRVYPLELVQYGRVFAWVCSGWFMTYLGNVVILGALLTCAHAVFKDDIGVGALQAVATAALLTATDIVISSAVVPQKNDILSQLGSTLLYGLCSWIAFKCIVLLNRDGVHEAYVAGAISIVAAICLAVSYVIEKVRWYTTIRGIYGKLL